MPQTIMLTGDVNLMNVTAPDVPFRLVAPIFKQSGFVFSNLECCFYDPPGGQAVENEGFFAAPAAGEALKLAGIQAVGIANNVNYGEAAIKASLARLDELGIAHTGAGANRDAARAPVILERGGMRVGFLQRTSVYWPTNHEAGNNAPGVAVIRGHTAYQLPLHKTRVEIPPCNRPGLPPVILTWADPQYLQWFKDDIAALRARCDVVVASCHWGLHREVLQYMTGDRCRRGRRDGPRTALLAAGRSLQGQTDLLWAGRFFLPHRPRRQKTRRLGGDAGENRARRPCGGGRDVSIRAAQRSE
jgi:Bacterial capsule synthesis protein PGA_cap